MAVKTLFLATQTQGHGGIPRFNRNLIDAIRQGDNDLTILGLNDKTTSEVSGYSRNKLRYVAGMLLKVLFNKYDVLLIGHINLISLSLVRILRPKMKVVMIMHGVEVWDHNPKVPKWVSRIDDFWAVSNYTKNRFAELYQLPVESITRIWNTLPKDWDLPTEEPSYKPYFLSVTRLDKNEGYKGVDKTLAAVAQLSDMLAQKGFKYKLLVSGNDVDRHKEMVEEFGIGHLVKFEQQISDEELKNLYRDCSFFVLPSTGEGFGIVFLESMMYKKATIGCFDCGTEDVIDHEKTGFLIEQNTAIIAEKIAYLIDNPDANKAMGEQGFEKLKNEYVFSTFKEKINLLLRQVCVA